MQNETFRFSEPKHACRPPDMEAVTDDSSPNAHARRVAAGRYVIQSDQESPPNPRACSGPPPEQILPREGGKGAPLPPPGGPPPEQILPREGEYLRTQGVLDLLPISRRTLFRWMDNGQLKYIRAGARLILFRRADIERMLQKLTVGRAVP